MKIRLPNEEVFDSEAIKDIRAGDGFVLISKRRTGLFPDTPAFVKFESDITQDTADDILNNLSFFRSLSVVKWETIIERVRSLNK